MPKLKTVRDSLLNAHSENILDDEELLLLFGVNRSTNLGLPYWSYERFNLDSWSEDEFQSELRFLPGNIKNLVYILQLPHAFKCNNGVVYDSVEDFCIFLKRFVYPCRYQDIMYRFAWAVSQLCMISNIVLDVLFNNWSHLLRTFQQNWFSQQHLEHVANMIFDKGVLLDNFWGFVDGTVHAISRPGIHQIVLYYGHKRYHALKFQSVVAPNGLITNLYGPDEGKRHGSGMLMDSGLLNQLQQYWFSQNQRPLCIYSDPAGPLRAHLQAGFKRAQLSQQQAFLLFLKLRFTPWKAEQPL